MSTDQSPEPPEPTGPLTQSTSAKPHHWTVWLAAGALVISVGSAVVTYRNGTIAEEAVRLSQLASSAVIRATEARIIRTEAHEVWAEVIFENYGKSEATNLQVGIRSTVIDNGIPIVIDKGVVLGSVAAGERKVAPLHSDFIDDRDVDSVYRSRKTITVLGSFEYLDSTTGERRLGALCFNLEPRLKSLTLELPTDRLSHCDPGRAVPFGSPAR